MASSIGSAVREMFRRGLDLDTWLQIASFTAAMLFFALLDRKLELRERGIVHMGSMVPWEEIESWSWDVPESTPMSLFGTRGAEEMLLKIQRRRAIQFLPPVVLRVAPRMEDDITRVMNKYLSDWPQA
jgi:hypothetical protein